MNLAQSLKEMLEADYDITIVDPQDPGIGRSYVWMSRHFRQFLTWQYTLTDNAPVALWLQRVLALRSRRRFQRVIEQARPQLIIVTHAFLSYVVARASEHLHIPLVFQLTDLGQLHMTWFSEKHATAYLAPSREIFMQALEQGIARERLHLTGRPLRRQFLEASERNETLAALKLDPGVLTLFLQGGALVGTQATHTARFGYAESLHDLPGTYLADPWDGLEQSGDFHLSDDVIALAILENLGQARRTVLEAVLDLGTLLPGSGRLL